MDVSVVCMEMMVAGFQQDGKFWDLLKRDRRRVFSVQRGVRGGTRMSGSKSVKEKSLNFSIKKLS